MSNMNKQNFSRTLAAWILCWTLMAPPSQAQQLPVVVKPNGPVVARSYMGTAVAPVFLHNSNRIRALLRSGNLYLTVQDALALAIENNLNLEVQRYSLPTADWSVERNEAGGPIRGLSGSTANV